MQGYSAGNRKLMDMISAGGMIFRYRNSQLKEEESTRGIEFRWDY
jgi:hypothetical protein